MSEEKDIKKIVEDVKQCIFEGRSKEDCLVEIRRKHDVTDEDIELVRWEVEHGKGEKNE